jgi:hypothetical protein
MSCEQVEVAFARSADSIATSVPALIAIPNPPRDRIRHDSGSRAREAECGSRRPIPFPVFLRIDRTVKQDYIKNERQNGGHKSFWKAGWHCCRLFWALPEHFYIWVAGSILKR